MEFLAWFEGTALSAWIREELILFPILLVLHAIGMAIVVGANVVLAWRLFTGNDPSYALARLTPLVWVGFAASLASGLLLLVGYPTKGLTNPLFYFKLGLVVLGLVLFVREQPPAVRASSYSTVARGVALLLVWFGAIIAGRLLAYTARYLLASVRP